MRASASQDDSFINLPVEISPSDIDQKRVNQQTFVLNIVTRWCPDCTIRQAAVIKHFIERMQHAGVEVVQCTVQHQKGLFLSEEHEALTNFCGGHGYPRTVLFIKGDLANWQNVEVVTEADLIQLADEFVAQLVLK